MVDLTPLMNAVISLVAVIITTFLIPWIKTRVTSEKLAQVQTYAKIAVQAAEIIYNGTGMGDAKKNYVLNFLQSKGYTMDIENVDALIESAVLELKADGMEINIE